MPGGKVDPVLAQLGAQLDALIEGRMGVVDQRVEAIGKDVDSLSRSVAILLHRQGLGIPTDDPDEEGPPVEERVPDKVWRCEKCGTRLGFYDEGEEMMRIRAGDTTLWVVPGIGGALSMSCGGCGRINSISDERTVVPSGGEDPPG